MSDASCSRFVWYDLMTPDAAAGRSFYQQVTGWTTQEFGDFPEPYHMFVAGETPIGGCMKLPPEAGVPPHWIGYVGVADVDATTAEAKRLGGTVIQAPDDIPEVGRFSIVADPQGAVFAIFQPLPGAPDMESWQWRAGTVAWHELTTTDYQAAFRFYQQLFGWNETSSFDMGPDGVYMMFGCGTDAYGGMWNRPPQMQDVPPNWGFYIATSDLDAAVDRVRTGGGTVLNGPMEVPGGDRIANCMDPQGGFFSLHERA